MIKGLKLALERGFTTLEMQGNSGRIYVSLSFVMGNDWKQVSINGYDKHPKVWETLV